MPTTRRRTIRKGRLFKLHPAEIAFLLDNEDFCRSDRDKASLEALRRGERMLLFGEDSLTAGELLAEFGEEALAIFQAEHPGKKPSWWKLWKKDE